MKRIAFYLFNQSLSQADLSSVIDGNPGIGGSEYEILLVSYLLENKCDNIQSFLFSNLNGKLPHKNTRYVYNLKECCELCQNENISTLVLDIKQFDESILSSNAYNFEVVIWAHNYAGYYKLNLFWKLPYIKQVVNVGREELEWYRDHICTLKSTYIYNIFPVKSKEYYLNKMSSDRNHNVVYMGSLVRTKGFHVLAKAWPYILEKVPDAQLYVIGAGTLYDKNATMGKYNVAEESYEKEIMLHLTDSKGAILPSVHFLGLMGEEKYDVMGKCKVGVPNPTGESETFCICAIEMQLMGCNITTIQHPAYYDTVLNKKFLYKHEKDLADYVVRRLLDDTDNYDAMYDFVESNFGVENNILKWEDVLLYPEKKRIEPCSEYFRTIKLIKSLLLNCKIKIPLLRKLPPVSSMVNIGGMINNISKR